jgi:hypothetical protein
MSQIVESNCRTFVAGGAIAQHLRVAMSGGKLVAAAITDGPGLEYGTLENPAFADNDVVAVRLRNACGTRKMVAAGPVTLHAKVYTAASGKVSATAAATSYLRGIALEAAGADGDVFEVLDVEALAAESG